MGLWSDLNLPMERCGLTALVGGGGKTTTLYALAREAAEEGRTVLITTTTHMLPHPRLPITSDLSALPDLLAEARIVLLARRQGEKWTEAVDRERLRGLAEVVLVEADGSRQMPFKAPADYEPAVPENAGAVIAVAGLRALGRPAVQVCHRPERVCALLDKPPEAPVTTLDLARVLSSPEGGRKGVPAGALFRCLLNQADTPEMADQGKRIAGLLAEKGIHCAIHSYQEEERGGLCWF